MESFNFSVRVVDFFANSDLYEVGVALKVLKKKRQLYQFYHILLIDKFKSECPLKRMLYMYTQQNSNLVIFTKALY